MSQAVHHILRCSNRRQVTGVRHRWVLRELLKGGKVNSVAICFGCIQPCNLLCRLISNLSPAPLFSKPPSGMVAGAVWSDVRITNERIRSSCGRDHRACTRTEDDDEDDEELP